MICSLESELLSKSDAGGLEMKKRFAKAAFSLTLIFAFAGTVHAATPENPWKFNSNHIQYYNDGSNSFYEGIWNTGASRWNGTGSVSMGKGTKFDFRTGNKKVSPTKDNDWDGICYTTYANGIATKTRAWVNEYYTSQTRYTSSIVEGIATHELGHALGLAHNDNESSVMRSNTFWSDGSLARTNTSPTSADKETIKKKYGEMKALSQANPFIPVVHFDVSWAYGYKSYEALASDVDLIVEGQIVQANDVKKAANSAPETYRTVSVVQVSNVLKGDAAIKNTFIHVTQMGGSDGEAIVVSDDTTPLQYGDESILFLKINTDGTYRVVNENTSIFLKVSAQNLQEGNENVPAVYQNQKSKVLISKDELLKKMN